MVTKAEAETAIRRLCREWANETGALAKPDAHPSYSDFTSWLHAKGFGYLLQFRSRMGAREDVERWFDQELRQTWRQ